MGQDRLEGPADFWNDPVVSALDFVDTLPGFGADRVEWGAFRFAGAGPGSALTSVYIVAHPAADVEASEDDRRVRFGVDDNNFGLSTTENSPETRYVRRPLSSGQAAEILVAPERSVEMAVAAIRPALILALTRYNVTFQPSPPALGGAIAARAPTPLPWRSTDSVAARRPTRSSHDRPDAPRTGP